MFAYIQAPKAIFKTCDQNKEKSNCTPITLVRKKKCVLRSKVLVIVTLRKPY